MDIRIGIQNSPREIGFESAQTAAEIESAVADVVSGSSPVLKLKDAKGAVYLVPAATLAYVEIGTEESRRIGFVA
ncbi:DUF3107 domain-containing protein [Agromyces atrinae]|uniref:DUF3107 domain-containing protein n=1 Tax=Agromyces atrinae TaxID=592376 RepID=A0A4V1R1V9_9MICO|nr:DUF3107 domain-containing protein [Agromyces atrinae]MCI2959190.1 DUF3107 domain-containing protein [Agromyces atrinae]NYD65592.1 hypothetical protein [Agromyces atrinae]RXZ85016.1 DUF3107 domain-containing protein [Agromyces atrinae]